MKKILALLFLVSLIPSQINSQSINRGTDFLLPADFNFPVRLYMWEVSGDDPFVSDQDIFKIGLSYNYSSAEKYFNADGDEVMVKMSFRQFNKGDDPGGYFRKHGALLNVQYHFAKLNKLVLRLPFTFTEINSFSSTTDVKPQPEWIKPRGPFQDVELSYTRKLNLARNIDIFGGAGLSIPTSRPKRYLDPPHGGNGNRWTNNINLYISGDLSPVKITTGAKLILKFPLEEELFTPTPFGIGFPFLYDTTQITPVQMNDFIEANPYSAEVKMGTQFVYDLVLDYMTRIGFSGSLQFQYFNSPGDEFNTGIPYYFTRVNNNITPVEFITKIDGGHTGTMRLYLKQDFNKISNSNFSFILGFGQSIFGKNSPQEANLLFGLTGTF
jgi:hypothetical protein